MADMNNLVRNPLVLGGAAVVIVGAIVGAYFLGTAGHGGGTAAGTVSSANALSARGVCEATLDRAHAFGILDASATLTSKEAAETKTANRVTCTAKSGDATYTITVDQTCTDMANSKCIRLWSVTDSTGKSLFSRSDFLPPQE